MATVQDSLLRVIQRIAPTTKDGQVIQDDSAAVNITGAANNGSGLIRITAAGHGLASNQKGFIKGVVGTTEANNTVGNPAWTVTVISSSLLDLQGSTFTNVYTSGGTIVGALAGTVDPSSFTRQRILDIYNQVRLILVHLMVQQYPQAIVTQLCPGLAKRKTDLTFASGVATKPAGVVAIVNLETAGGVQISVVPISMRKFVASLDAAAAPIALDNGQTFTGVSGSTYITNASTYVLEYIGIDAWTLSDVIFFSGTESVETFNDDWLPIIVEGCAALADGMGVASVKELLSTMVAQMVK